MLAMLQINNVAGIGTGSTLASPVPAMHRVLFHYNALEWLTLPLFFSACKFLQLPVQVHVGFLTGPVTADHTHDDPGQYEYATDDKCRLHMISVPCIRPSMSAIAIALTNMPVMIQMMSI